MLGEKIEDRSALVGVLGLGYAGLPLASAFLGAGFRVMGLDTDPEKIRLLERGENYVRHLGQEMAAGMRDSGRFEPTADLSRLDEPDAVLICVPTPLGRDKEPDLRFVEGSARALALRLRRGQLVVLGSTTWPGTTRGVVEPILRESGLRAGEDYLLAYSPEREDPGRRDLSCRTIPRLVGGTCERSGREVQRLYSAAVGQVHLCGSAEVAEAAKLLENVFRSVNIALVNQLKVILDAMGIDPWEVIEAAATKPFGFMKFTPGPGLGGHCIPIDPYYLSWVAKRAGRPARFIELAGEINTRMPRYVIERTAEALGRAGKTLEGARILVLGLAYKADVDDVRESPAIALIELLEEAGAEAAYSDPHVPHPPPMREHDLSHLRSIELDEGTLAAFDAVIVATDHAAFDWEMIAENARLVVDTRNALADRLGGREGYVKA